MTAEKQHVPVEDSEMLQTFKSISNFCWCAAKQWDWFAKSTIGKQLVTCADSIGANLTEGAGRYGKADALHFFIMARASARETRYWLALCAERDLIDKADVDEQIKKLEGAARALNALITYRRNTDLQVKESHAVYDEKDTRHETQDILGDITHKTKDISDPEDTRHNTQDIFDAMELEPDCGSHLMEEND
jgi:four helix bundle protein